MGAGFNRLESSLPKSLSMYPLSAILLLLNLTANFCKYNDHKINKINKTKIFKSLIHIE
jgi:hypothetical protein